MLDLIISTEPFIIVNVTTVPGISDHEVVIFQLKVYVEKCTLTSRKIYQFHKANDNVIKQEVFEFSQAFFSENPYQRSVEENWVIFKEAIHNIIERNIPTKIMRSHKDLPWLHYLIKCKMKRRSRLYIRAKCTQLQP